MVNILILCTSNSIRSQLSEGYLNFYAEGRFNAFSAGLTNKGINPYTIMVMAEDNLDISNQMSKSYSAIQDIHFDYLITVCERIKYQIPPTLRFDNHLHMPFPDPDEFEGSPADKVHHFRMVRDSIKREMLRFIGEHIANPLQQIA